MHSFSFFQRRKQISKYTLAAMTNTHEQSLLALVHCMVNKMRAVPVMRESRAVLITFSRSEDLCQSLRAHFIQPENSTKSPRLCHFTSFSLFSSQQHNSSSWSIVGLLCPFARTFLCRSFVTSSPLHCFPGSPPCISLFIYVNPFAVRMKLV